MFTCISFFDLFNENGQQLEKEIKISILVLSFNFMDEKSNNSVIRKEKRNLN